MGDLKIVADRNMRGVEAYFSGQGCVHYVDGRSCVAADVCDADILLVRSVTPVNESLLAGSAVKFVGTATSGFDHVDTDYLQHQGIGFSHAPGSNANSVVEYVLGAVAASGSFLEELLAGQSVGIVGYGNIGKALAIRLEALGIAYVVYDPWLAPEEVANAASLQKVLSCTVISLHAELTRRQPWPSYHLLSTNELSQLGSSQLLINACRGEVIDGAALLERLQTGSAPEVVLDVWEGEPHPNKTLLERAAIGSAHIAGYSLDGKLLATRMLRDAMVNHLGLEPPTTSAINISAAEPLLAPADAAGVELLRWAVQARYDIRADDKLLRQAMLDGTLQTGAFDQLRKSYRDRRELAGTTVSVVAGNTAQTTFLKALGCVVTETGGSID
ncbi:MAG: 4-phosphoerythronate dehydrogenase [Halioglobus sp.]